MDIKKVLSQLILEQNLNFLEPFYVEVEFEFFDGNKYAGRILIVAFFTDELIPCQSSCSSGVSMEAFRIIDVYLDEEHLINVTSGALIRSHGVFEILDNHVRFVLKEKLICIKRIMNQRYLNCLLKMN